MSGQKEKSCCDPTKHLAVIPQFALEALMVKKGGAILIYVGVGIDG
jgi:hypothetical protein